MNLIQIYSSLLHTTSDDFDSRWRPKIPALDNFDSERFRTIRPGSGYCCQEIFGDGTDLTSDFCQLYPFVLILKHNLNTSIPIQELITKSRGVRGPNNDHKPCLLDVARSIAELKWTHTWSWYIWHIPISIQEPVTNSYRSRNIDWTHASKNCGNNQKNYGNRWMNHETNPTKIYAN